MDAIAFLLCFLFIYCGVQGGDFPSVYGSLHIAQEGDSVLLPCTYSVAAENIAILQWTVNGTNSTPLAQYFAGDRLVTQKYNLTADYALQITDLTKSDSGLYSCLVQAATLEADKYYYQRLHVTQNGKDTSPTHETVATAYVGGRAILPCQDPVAADDVSIVQWTVEGADSAPLAQYFAGERHVTRKYNLTDDYSLEINDLTMSDSGMYKCFVHTSRLEADDFFHRQLNVIDKITTKPPRSPAGIIGSDIATSKPGASKSQKKRTLWPLVFLFLVLVSVLGVLSRRYRTQIQSCIESHRRDGGGIYSVVNNGTNSVPAGNDHTVQEDAIIPQTTSPNVTAPDSSSEGRVYSDSASPAGNAITAELEPSGQTTSMTTEKSKRQPSPESHSGERDRQSAAHTGTVMQLQRDDTASSPRVEEVTAPEKEKEENFPLESEVQDTPTIPERIQDDQASQVAINIGESTEDMEERSTMPAKPEWQQVDSLPSLVNARKPFDLFRNRRLF